MKFLIAMCLLAGVNAQYGASGVVNPDGTLVQFTREEADNIAAIGESGVVMKDGTHIQFDYDTAAHHANLPPAPMPVPVMVESSGPYGWSGLVMPEGDNVQFTPEHASKIVLIGPGGVVNDDGVNLQFDADGYPVRKKREVILEGPSGVLFADGQKRHLPPGVGIAVMSESGAVLTNGDNVQFRKKRDTTHGAVVGDSGLITPGGRLIQLAPGVTVVSAGPSAALLSTGEGIQYDRKKRSAVRTDMEVGESGIRTPGGRLIQLPHGVSVVLAGPSAALLSNGDYVQYEF